MLRVFLFRAMATACVVGAVAMPQAAGANPSILIDASTDTVLQSENPLQRAYPASLTKLMTTYVAFRAVQAGEVTLQSPVRVSKAAAALPPSKMGYKPGSELTLDNALKIIMVKSANDVARSIGESLAGSEAAFAARMNAESKRLGMRDSHWVNQHGLHDDDQYSTPRDIAILASALRREFPQYHDFFSIEGLATGGKAIPTHNNLIGRFAGADGMKTGYTCPAGFNLVASATRDGRTLMAVVVASESVDERDQKAAGLLEKGFSLGATAGVRLTELTGTPSNPISMADKLCSKEVRAAKAKAWKDLQKEIKAGRAVQPPPAPYQVPLPRPRQLVAVGLGGATGPLSKALAEATVYADVPLPTWRPDRPDPTGAQAAQREQGDAASVQQ